MTLCHEMVMLAEREHMPVASYRSGDWLAVAGVGTWVLLGCRPEDDVVSAVWSALGRGSSVQELGQILGGTEHYGIVAVTGSAASVVLAGSAVAELSFSGEGRKLECPPGVTVAQYRLDSATQNVGISGGVTTDRSVFPLASGVVRAGELHLEWDSEQATPLPAVAPAAPPSPILEDPAPPAAPTAPTAPILEDPASAVEQREDHTEAVIPPAGEPEEDPVVAGVRSESDGKPEAVAVAPPEPDPEVTLHPLPDSGLDPGPDPSPEPDSSAALTSALEPETQSVPELADDTYFDLFGNTINRSVEDAAVRPVEPTVAEEPAPPVEPIPSRPEPFPSPVVPLPPRLQPLPVVEPPLTPSQPDRRPAPAGLIDAVPLGTSPTPPAAPTPPAPVRPAAMAVPVPPSSAETTVDTDPNLEMTVSRPVAAALLQSASVPAATVAPTVHAVRCVNNHPNPAHAGICRACNAPIPDQSPITVPRPVLGRLRLSTGGHVVLDRGVLIGRGPSEGRLVGGERPHLVKLPSPDHDISRNHVEVRIDGWHVLVTDLNSTNGTLIIRPGMEPERLRPEQPTMIEPGTVVSLSDTVSLAYEVNG